MDTTLANNHPIICLTSLSHSGSTVFSMALACHENVVSLGEVYQVLREGPEYWLNNTERLCSCGQSAFECEFWHTALNNLCSQDIISPAQPNYFINAYHSILNTFKDVHGNQYCPVDTSKGTKHLQLFAQSETINPKALLLIRDVRAYTCSQTKLARSQNRKGLKKVKGHYWYQMLRWHHGNTKRENLLNSLRLPYITIGYESFCFNEAATLSKTFDFLGLKEQQKNNGLSQSKHHVLFGNPMKNCSKRKAEVRYDARWLHETDYMGPAAIFPFVMQYNKSRVYANR